MNIESFFVFKISGQPTITTVSWQIQNTNISTNQYGAVKQISKRYGGNKRIKFLKCYMASFYIQKESLRQIVNQNL